MSADGGFLKQLLAGYLAFGGPLRFLTLQKASVDEKPFLFIYAISRNRKRRFSKKHYCGEALRIRWQLTA